MCIIHTIVMIWATQSEVSRDVACTVLLYLQSRFDDRSIVSNLTVFFVISWMTEVQQGVICDVTLALYFTESTCHKWPTSLLTLAVQVWLAHPCYDPNEFARWLIHWQRVNTAQRMRRHDTRHISSSITVMYSSGIDISQTEVNAPSVIRYIHVGVAIIRTDFLT